MNVWRLRDESYIHKYGIDLFLGLAKRWPQDRFEIFLGDSPNKDLLRKLCDEMDLRNVDVHDGKYLAEHFRYCDVFLRPNRADAYGVSIQEALDAGVPAIASNVCTRPAGTHLFTTGDLEALDDAYRAVRIARRPEMLAGVESTDFHMRLLDLYKFNLTETNDHEAVDTRL
jgi:glycosyltransferase involved in cell wall biosynthesis